MILTFLFFDFHHAKYKSRNVLTPIEINKNSLISSDRRIYNMHTRNVIQAVMYKTLQIYNDTIVKGAFRCTQLIA